MAANLWQNADVILFQLLLWFLLAACQRGAVKSEGQECRFLQEERVADGNALAYDSITLIAMDRGAVAVWSDPTGLYARLLDRDGAPREKTKRLGARCRGGVSAAVSAKGVEVLCMQPAFEGDPGALVLLRIDRKLELEKTYVLASLGSLSEGVSAVVNDEVLWVAFYDAAPDNQVTMLAEVPLAAPEKATVQRLSRAARAAGPPWLLKMPDGLYATWSETFLEHGEPRALLMRAKVGRDPKPVAEVLPRSPRPQLFAAFGRSYLAFRDRPKGHKSTGLFAMRLGAAGQDGPKVRMGRADGDAVPSLCFCEGGLFASTPRVYAGDYFVGVHRLNEGLTPLAPEQQFYEDAHAFYQVASACVDRRPLLLVAERSEPGQANAILRAVPFTCRP